MSKFMKKETKKDVALAILVGTYRAAQMKNWILPKGCYNYPIGDDDDCTPEHCKRIKELWLYKGKSERKVFSAKFIGVKTRAELPDYPATKEKPHGKKYLLFKVAELYGPQLEDATVHVRISDFTKRTQKIAAAIKAFQEGSKTKPKSAKRLSALGTAGILAEVLPSEIAQVPPERLCIRENAVQLDLCLQFDISEPPASERVSLSKAMQILSLSRHSYSKLVSRGVVVRRQAGEDSYFLMSDLEKAKKSAEYIDMKNGIVDRRNTLNDLTGKDWIPETKSYLYQKGLGADSAEAEIERMHPAPYSFQDIGHLIRFFTKRGMRVLDPFGGVGSTAKACEIDGRVCTSIELSPKWHELSIRRLEVEVGQGTSRKHDFINGDSCEVLRGLGSNSVDFVVTSPPYWGILNKQDQKVKRDRVSRNLDTKYSDDKRDLGNVIDYREFLDIIVERVFLQCARVLRHKKYMAIVVSDFRDKNQFVSFHSDLIVLLNNAEIPGGGVLRLQGTKVLIQNHKSLLPYGYPFAYVENIHHQYILIFKKGS